jgi:hypothetical protein
MPMYVAETYLPRSDALGARAASWRARVAAENLSREGTGVRYVRTTFLPTDETCFHVFEADSAASVEEVSRRAELGRARIVPAIETSRPARRRSR